MFSADVLAVFTHALHIWDHYVGLVTCVVPVLTGPLFGSIFVLLDVNSV